MELIQRIEQLERRVRILAVAFVVVLAGLAAVSLRAQPGVSENLRVRQITVVDQKGVERVRIGAPLPDPRKEGRRVPRQGVVSGILIHDADGDERGGYVVSDTGGGAMLTLDAKGGQQTIFVANREGGANLSVWSGANRNDNYVSIRAVPRPMIEIVEGGKRICAAGGPDAFTK